MAPRSPKIARIFKDISQVSERNLKSSESNIVIFVFVCLFVCLELLWPEGDEALSGNAVGSVENILILEAEHRPGALGTFSVRRGKGFHSHNPSSLLPSCIGLPLLQFLTACC